MKILADLHHSGLYASLHYLFEDRLGAELYRPIGTEWFTEGYWKIAEPYNNHPATITQYLEIRSTAEDGTGPLNEVKHITQEGVHHIWDFANEYYQKAITLDVFKQMDFDFVIASIPAHIVAYTDLIRNTGGKAKLIYQMGNIGWHDHIPWHLVNNIMASVKKFPVPGDKNVVFYRQEFDLKPFMAADSKSEMRVSSFVNCLPNPDLFLSLEREMPTYSFKSFGIACRDGIQHSVKDIANEMARSMWGYHFKPFGDGYGHVIHNWFAAGKPIIVGLDDYKDKLAGELLEDEITCIDISKRRPIEVANIISNMNSGQYERMCTAVKNRFKMKVDFQRDASNVERFLNDCV